MFPRNTIFSLSPVKLALRGEEPKILTIGDHFGTE